MSKLSRKIGKVTRKSPVATIVIGVILLIYSLFRLIPTYIDQIKTVEVTAVCMAIRTNNFIYGEISASYQYAGRSYEYTFENALLTDNIVDLKPGDEFTAYINTDDPSEPLLLYPELVETINHTRNRIYIRYGLYAIIATTTIIVGISTAVLKKKSLYNIPATYTGYQGPQTPGGMTGGSMPSYQTGSSPSFVSSSSYNDTTEAFSPTPFFPATPPPTYANTFSSAQPTPPANNVPVQNEATTPIDSTSQNNTADASPTPEEKKTTTTPSTPISPTDLSSIIKSSSDDAFNMSADDFKADESLAALIKNGSDDQPLLKIEPEPDDNYEY